MKLHSLKKADHSRTAVIAGATAIAAAVYALWVESKARRAEREHPPIAQLIDIDGVRLHYVDRGQGPAVVLLHGNAVSLMDFEASGLIDRLAQKHRVIAFDRPGFGFSSRPRDRLWTPAAQAELLAAAFDRLGIHRPVVLGHSMGTMVAVELGLNHADEVAGLVLVGGYFYPSLRLDALLTAPVALPLVGDVMRHTVTAAASRLSLDAAVRQMFAPNPVPPEFYALLSRELMLRPSQLRANAEDAAFMIPAARAGQKRHGELQMPVDIVAGADDQVVDPQAQSVRLHDDLSDSTLTVVPSAGHMVHHAWTDELVNLVESQFAAPIPTPDEAPRPLPAEVPAEAGQAVT